MVQCVKLMLVIFEFRILLFDCFVHCQNLPCLKRFTRYGYCAGEVEDVIIGRLACLKRFTRYGYCAGEVEDVIIGKLIVVS